MRARAVLIALACLGGGCGLLDTDGGEPAGLDQDVVFDVCHVNHAWGYRLAGWYVDGKGRVWRYDHSDEPWTATGDTIAFDALLEKVTRDREQVGEVSVGELRRMSALIGAAALAEVGDPVPTGCADFGGISWLAYLVVPGQQAYRQVLLHQQGDIARPVSGEAARALYEWLRRVTGQTGEASCDP